MTKGIDTTGCDKKEFPPPQAVDETTHPPLAISTRGTRVGISRMCAPVVVPSRSKEDDDPTARISTSTSDSWSPTALPPGGGSTPGQPPADTGRCPLSYGELPAIEARYSRDQRLLNQALGLFLATNSASDKEPVGPLFFLAEDWEDALARFRAYIGGRPKRNQTELLKALKRLHHTAKRANGEKIATLPPQPHRSRLIATPTGFPATWQGCFDHMVAPKSRASFLAHRTDFQRFLRLTGYAAHDPFDPTLFINFEVNRDHLRSQVAAEGLGESACQGFSSTLNALRASAWRIRPWTPPRTGVTFGQALARATAQAGSNAKHHSRTWRDFLVYCGADFATPISPCLTTDFAALSAAFIDTQAKKGRGAGALHNLRQRLDLLAMAGREEVIATGCERSFAETLSALVEASGVTLEQVAERAQINSPTLNNWVHGKVRPQLSGRRGEATAAKLARLEQILGLDEGALRRLVRPGLPAPAASPPTAPHRERASYLLQLPYRITLPPKVEAQFAALVAHHTRPLPGRGIDGTVLLRATKGIWRTTKRGSPTEQICRQMLASFCGFLILPADPAAALHQVDNALGGTLPPVPDPGALLRGKGLPKESIDLCMITDDCYIQDFLHFLAVRNGGWSGHQKKVVHKVMAIIHPKWGFLPQHPELAFDYWGQLPIDPKLQPKEWAEWKGRWVAHCEEAYRTFLALAQWMEVNVGKSRDPCVLLAPVLSAPDPMEILLLLERRLKADEPGPGQAAATHAAWLRDLLLVACLNRNPLRLSHWVHATWRADNSRNFYRSGPGWRLRFDACDFKNEKGAAKHSYDQELSPELWPLIEQYVSKERRHLADAAGNWGEANDPQGKVKPTSDRLFLTRSGQRDGTFTESTLSERLEVLVARYLPEYLPWRAHAWRHIVATAWLKTHPNDFATAALILHDKLSTVLEHYGHLRVEDGLARFRAHIAEKSKHLT